MAVQASPAKATFVAGHRQSINMINNPVICPECQQGFTCGVQAGSKQCFCMQLPAMFSVPKKSAQTAQCLCPTCLAKKTGQAIEETLAGKTLAEQLVLAKQYKTQSSLIEYIDYQIENGFHVFSRWYHLKRGTCCGNGCRHCPYGDN